MIKQLPATKRTYRGKNMNGGRKCFFKQSIEYKAKKSQAVNAAGIATVATTWNS